MGSIYVTKTKQNHPNQLLYNPVDQYFHQPEPREGWIIKTEKLPVIFNNQAVPLNL